MKMLRILALILALPVFFSACAHHRESDFGHYSKAEKYYSQGKYKNAIDEYAAYLVKEPAGNMAVIASYYTAKSQAALGNTAEAIAGYQSIIEKHSTSAWAGFSKARLKELTAQK